jgi:hypothetical protein
MRGLLLPSLLLLSRASALTLCSLSNAFKPNINETCASARGLASLQVDAARGEVEAGALLLDNSAGGAAIDGGRLGARAAHGEPVDLDAVQPPAGRMSCPRAARAVITSGAMRSSWSTRVPSHRRARGASIASCSFRPKSRYCTIACGCVWQMP